MIAPKTDLLAEAKRALPLSRYLAENGFGDRAKKSARCMFHEDGSASFSLYTGEDGEEHWKCFAGCGGGDVVDFIARHRGLSNGDACRELIRLAGVSAPRPQPTAADSVALDWPRCVRDFTPDQAARFAKWRALSPEFVAWLNRCGLIGLFQNRLAFPVANPGGAVLRAHVRAVKRQADGSENVFWFYSPKGPGLPLIIGDPRTAAVVWGFESQFDMFAALDLAGWHTQPDGLPGVAAVATRGAENSIKLAGLITPAATLLLFSQNDAPRADRPETPAQKWTREAAAHAACQTVQIVSTPGDFKDLNDALRAGLTPDEFRAALAAAQPYTAPIDLHGTAPRKNVSTPSVTLPPEDDSDAADTTTPFPVELLPVKLATIIQAAARCERVPAALPAVCALGCVSAALGAGLEITSGPGRVSRGNLFLLASAESGSGKSQVFRRIAEPIVEHQHQLHEAFRATTGPKLASEIAVLTREVASLEKKAARSTDDSDRQRMLGELEFKNAKLADLKLKNFPPCVTCGDVTSEKLAALLAANREVLFSASPEARQIVEVVCGRYNSTKSTDEAIYLSGFSGDFLRVDRLGRDPLTLRNPCLSVLWLLQPDAMGRLFETDTLLQSGFLPRFLCCHTEAAPRMIEDGGEGISDGVRGQWAGLLGDLLSTFHAAEKPFRVEPSPEAKRLLDDFFNAIVERRSGDLADVGAFAARYAEQGWRVALCFHAAFHGAEAHQHALDAETARNAISVVEWFIAAQLAVLAKGRRQAAAKIEDEVFKLLESNAGRKGQDFTTARELQRARVCPTADAARALLAKMERSGLLLGEDVAPLGGGKPTRIFRPVRNPVPG